MMYTRAPALCRIATVVLAAWSAEGHCFGLGPIQVQSALGQPLRVSIPLLGADTNDLNSNCIKAKLLTTDGSIIIMPDVSITRTGATATANVVTTQPVGEPAVSLVVDAGCSVKIHRDYQLLLDPQVFTQPLVESSAVSQPDVQTKKTPVSAAGGTHKGTKSSHTSTKTHSGKKRSESAPMKMAQAYSEHAQRATAKSGLTTQLNVTGSPRNVLKMSGNEAVGDKEILLASLRLSGRLSEVKDDTNPQKAEEIRAAQARFAAVLRGEDPAALAEGKVKSLGSQLQTAQTIAEQAKRETEATKVAMEEVKRTSFSITWIAGLASLLLVSVGAAGWLALRLNNTRKNEPASFLDQSFPDENTESVEEPEQEPEQEGFTPSITKPSKKSLFRSFGKNKKQSEPDDFGPLGGEPVDVHENSAASHVVENSIGSRSAPPKNEALDAPMLARQAEMENYAEGSQTYQVRDGLLKVEEITDVMQEAEFWMLFNDPQRAIDVLEPYCDAERPDSPGPYLYLLDLYREVDNQEKYEALRENAAHVFNARIPKWDERIDESQLRTLEDYAGLIKDICGLWGSMRIIPFLENLIFDDRKGDRQGFDLPVYRDIMLLISIARELERASRLDLQPVNGTRFQVQNIGNPSPT